MDDLQPLESVELPTTEDALAREVRRTYPGATVETLSKAEAKFSGQPFGQYRVHACQCWQSPWCETPAEAWLSALKKIREGKV